jgi:subtilisin-like proprotein convertase family protein
VSRARIARAPRFAACLAAGIAAAATPACSPSKSLPDSGVHLVPLDGHDVSPPLRELARRAPSNPPDDDEVGEAEPLRLIPHHWPDAAGVRPDPAVQTELGTGGAPTLLGQFEGMGAGLNGFQVHAAPPDTDGDIGPDHYVQIVNSGITIFNRAGTVVLGPMNTNTLFNGFNGACATTNDGDGVVRYDRIADRWVISQFSVNRGAGPFFQCIAVSTSPDPTGSYNRYQFTFDGFNDYPKMGLWPDAYYFTFNMFDSTQHFVSGRACAFDRAKMLLGAAATEQCFNTGISFGSLLPSDLDGPTQPPAGAPNFLLALDFNALDFWRLHIDFANPASSTLIGPTTIPVNAFTPLCNGGTCVPQPGGNQLDSLADRLMNRLVYRRFDDHEAMLVSHSIVAGTSGGVRWYELRSPSATPTVFQQGTYAPDAAVRWMGSLAFDSGGDIGLGFSVASTTVNPSIRFTGRFASDLPGIMTQGETSLISGGGAQGPGLSRWGDYSSMNIDPSDDCTFWYTQEYEASSGTFNWHTRVGAFSLGVSTNVSATNLPIAIPDNDPLGITSTIPVTGAGDLSSLALSVNITHPYRGDLVVTLISPAGTEFTVSARQGGNIDNIALTKLGVNAFNGEAASGTWTLRVADLGIADTGTLDSWSLTLVGSCK